MLSGTSNTQDKKAAHLRNRLSSANNKSEQIQHLRHIEAPDISSSKLHYGGGICTLTGIRKQNSAWCWHPYLTCPYCNTQWPWNSLTWNNTGKGHQQPAYNLHDLQLQACRNPQPTSSLGRSLQCRTITIPSCLTQLVHSAGFPLEPHLPGKQE